MLPAAAALIAPWPSGFIGGDVLHGVGTFLFGSALPGIESSGLWVSGSLLGTTASADSPSGCPNGASPGKNALLPGATAAFTSASGPFDFAVWCQLVASRPAFYAVLVHRPASFL